MISSISCIAILAPGQMGSSFATLFKHQSPKIRVITALNGRSPRTKQLAQEAGIEDVRSYEEVLQHADVVLSILVPSQAVASGRTIATLASSLSPSSLRSRYFVDLNAIAPSTSHLIFTSFVSTPIAYIDGGVIGGPATPTTSPLIVLSGEQAAALNEQLSPLFAGRTKVVGETNEGQASALKLSYASLAKGMISLATNAALLASEHGVLDALEEELGNNNPAALKAMQTGVPRNMAKVRRFASPARVVCAELG